MTEDERYEKTTRIIRAINGTIDVLSKRISLIEEKMIKNITTYKIKPDVDSVLGVKNDGFRAKNE